jgi:hypothetical protein
MSMGPIGRYIADWLGYADVNPKGNEKYSPFTALQQAVGIVAVIFAEPILKNLAGLPPSQIQIIRLVLLCLIIFLCNYVVTAKEKPPPQPEGTGPPAISYKYSDLDRLTSRIVLPLSLVVLIIMLIPEPKPCRIDAAVHKSPALVGEKGQIRSLEVSGGGETHQFPINDEGVSSIAVSPKQKRKWTLTLIDLNGSAINSVEIEGCLLGEKTFTLNGQTRLVLRPR